MQKISIISCDLHLLGSLFSFFVLSYKRGNSKGRTNLFANFWLAVPKESMVGVITIICAGISIMYFEPYKRKMIMFVPFGVAQFLLE